MNMKKRLGQFFTVDAKVCDLMNSLMTDPLGKVLEPSAGAGNLMLHIINRNYDSLTGFELDNTVPLLDDSLQVQYGDFFELSQGLDNTFNSIIGNPPYVAWKNVGETTRSLASQTLLKYSEKANLYHLFMDRCIDLLAPDGQLVFIVPKEWLYTTSALPLREKFLKYGFFTHIVDLGEAKVFPDADVPALMIFRYQKFGALAKKDETMFACWDNLDWTEKKLNAVNGYYSFSAKEFPHRISDFFDVKVGLVSGADKIFDVSNHTYLNELKKEDAVVELLTTKGVKPYFFVDHQLKFSDLGEYSRKFAVENKEILLQRKIRSFHDSNYWHWGAVRNLDLMRSDCPNIFAFNRTRQSNVFFKSDARFYSGGLLALYVKDNICLDLDKVVDYLNGSEFKESCYDFGLTTGDKLSLQPSTLSMIPVVDLGSLT